MIPFVTGGMMVGESAPRQRADAVRNAQAVREAAKAVFDEAGVDAPMRDIAARAGVGVGTVYRSYPVRSDLIIAVFRHELEETAAAADILLEKCPPPEALRRWAERLGQFVQTKQGFASALHSGDPAYAPLPKQFLGVLAPKAQRILDAGVEQGSLRAGIRAEDLIHALARLSDSGSPDGSDASAARMVEVLLDGITVARDR